MHAGAGGVARGVKLVPGQSAAPRCHCSAFCGFGDPRSAPGPKHMFLLLTCRQRVAGSRTPGHRACVVPSLHLIREAFYPLASPKKGGPGTAERPRGASFT